MHLHSKLSTPNLRIDDLFERLSVETKTIAREVITENLMTLHLTGGEILRLGNDLRRPFSPMLKTIENPALQQFLSVTDATPDSLTESGARDWADFKDRMHFITDLFRCYQDSENLFDAPFTPARAARFNSGTLPRRRV